MKIRNIMPGKIVGAVILLTALISWGYQDNKPLVYKTIHEAAEKGNLKDVERHLNRGADVNAKNNTGLTPLHMLAAVSGYKAVALSLIHI